MHRKPRWRSGPPHLLDPLGLVDPLAVWSGLLVDTARVGHLFGLSKLWRHNFSRSIRDPSSKDLRMAYRGTIFCRFPVLVKPLQIVEAFLDVDPDRA